MRSKNKNPWCAYPDPKPQAELRLFCLPYAGGSTAVFSSWPKQLPNFVEMCSIQLPGRGARLKEPPHTNLIESAQSIASAIVSECDKRFALFGHSMGAMLSFEITRCLRSRYGRMPAQIFVSGRRAPHLPKTEPQTYDLPKDEFIKELQRIEGTPEAVLNNEELLQLYIPVLRADFQACQTYPYKDGPPLDCPIVAYCGTQDEEEHQQTMEAWREQTTKSFKLRMIEGNHFFLHGNETTLLRSLSEELTHLVKARPASAQAFPSPLS